MNQYTLQQGLIRIGFLSSVRVQQMAALIQHWFADVQAILSHFQTGDEEE